MSRIGHFWSDAAGASLVVLSDFDFTISQVDVGDLITDNLGPPTAETLARFRRKEVGTQVYWQDSMARCDKARALRLADQVAIDPHFKAFAAWCAEQEIPLAVVSDGFGFYIERILQREGLGHLPVFCNEMAQQGQLVFPHANPVCDMCACCKPAVVRKAQALGNHIVYVGDGTSDMYASAFADWVFAKGRLAEHMEQYGSPYYKLDSFATVRRVLEGGLESFRDGSAPNRATLTPDPLCRFE